MGKQMKFNNMTFNLNTNKFLRADELVKAIELYKLQEYNLIEITCDNYYRDCKLQECDITYVFQKEVK